MSSSNSRFDHPILEKFVDRILAHGPRYYGAIQTSAETAEYNNAFASDVIAFCDYLIRGECSLPIMKRALQDLAEVANKAHDGAVEMNKRFRQIRGDLLKV